MSKKLNVLVIEDNDDDCHLLVNELRYGGFPDIHFECVKSETELVSALDGKKWDIILSDYNMPGFNGIEALKIIKNTGLDIPFVLVSGAIGEELAVNALKEGANDYLLKDRLYRLVSVVNRELEEAYRRKAFRESQEQLAIEKKNAEIANQRKSQVLAFVAHEFKNPINALLLHVNLLQKEIRGPLNEYQQEFVNNIEIGANLLQDLVKDILDIAAIEAGKINLHKQKIPIYSIINDIQAIIGPLAAQKNIQLLIDKVNPDFLIFADPKRLKQILINLLSNAVKYTRQDGFVKLNLEQKDNNVIIKVQDNGVGISQEELPQLFNEYYRAYNLLTTQSEGIGLGLAVTKHLIELHHGIITIDSKINEGTTFTVSLPQK